MPVSKKYSKYKIMQIKGCFVLMNFKKILKEIKIMLGAISF